MIDISVLRILQIIVFSQFCIVNGQSSPANTTGCITGPSRYYTGTQNVTFSGIPCQRWDSSTPHTVKWTPHDGANHSYCRNPDNDVSGTWCYTTDPDVRWQYCRIPKCPDFSLLVMTTRSSGSAQLLHIPADIEAGYPNITLEAVFNKSEGQFRSVAADKHGQRVFYGDVKFNNLGIFSFETNTTTTAMSGMMKDVEQLAYDWVTQNIYFNDYKKKWIMAVEKNFQYYTIVYRNISEEYYGLALHAKQRLLFFTTTDEGGFTNIKSTDLAGENVSIIFPKRQNRPSTIRSLAIDYTDDRLYWVLETLGFSSYVYSSRVDGSNLTLVHPISHRNVMGIAAYLDFVYVAENSQPIYNRLRVFTKRGEDFANLVSDAPLKGLAVYSDREEYSLDDSGLNDALAQEGECARHPPCDHICLPRLNARRQCRCLPGYYKAGDTQCFTRFLTDNYMAVVDKAQKRIFQLSLSENDHNYTAVETTSSDISALAINPSNGALFWYDRNTTAMHKINRNGANETRMITNVHVKSTAIDPLTGNVYYVDADTQTINVINSNGQYTKTLTSPTNRSTSWKIEHMALDIVNKHIYWTTSNEDIQEAELRRMGMDGSDPTLLLWNILSIKHILISYEIALDFSGRSLFLNVLRESFSEERTTVYEISLSSLQPSNGIPDSSTQYRIHFIGGTKLINELVVSGSTLYFTSNPTNGLHSIDLSDSAGFSVFANNLEEKNFFYNPRYLAVYEATQRRILSSLPNPCRNGQCGDLCLMTPQNTSVCACRNGFNLTGNLCQDLSERIETTIAGTDPPVKTTPMIPRTTETMRHSSRPFTSSTAAGVSSTNLSDMRPINPAKFLSTGAIAAIVLVAFAVILIFTGILYMRMKKKTSNFGVTDKGALTFLWKKTSEKDLANDSVYRNL